MSEKNYLHPFLKYPGGKTKEIPLVLKYMPVGSKRYIEPFVGGGSIYFALDIHPSFINDKSEDLYEIYSYIKTQNKKFYKYLKGMDDLWALVEDANFLVKVKNVSFVDFERFKNYYNKSLSRKEKSIEKFEADGITVSEKDKIATELTARKTAVYMIVRDIYNAHQKNKELHVACFYFLP